MHRSRVTLETIQNIQKFKSNIYNIYPTSANIHRSKFIIKEMMTETDYSVVHTFAFQLMGSMHAYYLRMYNNCIMSIVWWLVSGDFSILNWSILDNQSSALSFTVVDYHSCPYSKLEWNRDRTRLNSPWPLLPNLLRGNRFVPVSVSSSVCARKCSFCWRRQRADYYRGSYV